MIKKIELEGDVMSLSKAALILLHRDGYNWRTANGWQFWMFEDEALSERLLRLANTEDDE